MEKVGQNRQKACAGMRGLSWLIGHIVALFMFSFSFVSSPWAQSLELLQPEDENLLQKTVRHIFVKMFASSFFRQRESLFFGGRYHLLVNNELGSYQF